MRSKKLLGSLLGLSMSAALSVGVSACDMSGIFIKWSGESVSSSAIQNSSNEQNDDGSSAMNTGNENGGAISSSAINDGENDGSSGDLNENSNDDKKDDSSFDDSDYETDCVVYTLSEDGFSASVTGYTGSPMKVKILSTYQGVPVTSIGIFAFYNCSILTSITIPDSVTSIDVTSFIECSGLTSINVSENNTNYKSMDGDLYSKDGITLIQYAIGKTSTEFLIPDSVTGIGGYAFAGCSGLTSIEIPDSVTGIGGYAFAGCSGLTSIEIPNSVTGIGGSAFVSCGNLTSVIIGGGVTSIGDSAFYWCSNLAEVYYNGTESEWNEIAIVDNGNDSLISATRYYYSEKEPTEEGNYWHYVDGVVTKW